jgi:hypothetical protein
MTVCLRPLDLGSGFASDNNTPISADGLESSLAKEEAGFAADPDELNLDGLNAQASPAEKAFSFESRIGC